MAIRDICFLPEGEIHSRSAGTTPYELARDDDKYPLARIVATADLASNLDRNALPELAKLLLDSDSAVCYWAILGFRMRGRDAVAQDPRALEKALNDESPYVRIVAAETLGLYGSDDARAAAVKTLESLASPKANGVLVSMCSLAAIEALGKKGESLHDQVRQLDPNGASPHARYNSYVPRLIQNIARSGASSQGESR